MGFIRGSLADFGDGGEPADLRERDGADDSLSGEAGESGEMRWVVSTLFAKNAKRMGHGHPWYNSEFPTPKTSRQLKLKSSWPWCRLTWARTPSLAKSLRRSEQCADAADCIPMEPRLAKPHNAKVAMVKERGASTALCAPSAM